MPAPARKAPQDKKWLLALAGVLAATALSAFRLNGFPFGAFPSRTFQFGDRNGLNGLPFAKVQPLVSDLAKAQTLAQQGNIELLAGQSVPGNSVTVRGELTDANCYLGSHSHAYDHAFCAKLCAAAGSPLLFVPDQGNQTYVVLTPRNAVPLPASLLDQIGVPGIVIKGKTLDGDRVHALTVESLLQ
jgi:hypothetical protein